MFQIKSWVIPFWILRDQRVTHNNSHTDYTKYCINPKFPEWCSLTICKIPLYRFVGEKGFNIK